MIDFKEQLLIVLILVLITFYVVDREDAFIIEDIYTYNIPNRIVVSYELVVHDDLSKTEQLDLIEKSRKVMNELEIPSDERLFLETFENALLTSGYDLEVIDLMIK